MTAWFRRGIVALLFAALVVVLLWFQGILFRSEHPPAEVHAAPAVAAGDRTARAERRSLPTLQPHPGFVEARDPASLAPRVMASVLTIAVREGDEVSAGQVLVTLDDRDARARLSQAEAALEAAGAQAQQASLAYDRAQRLHDADALTAQEWEAARAMRDATEAQRERAEKGVEEAAAALAWFQLLAPFDGRVLARHADPGSLATPGAPLLTLFRPEQLRFRVAIPEERALDLAVGAELDVAFDRLPPHRGELTRIFPVTDPGSGTVTLHLALTPADDLRAGLLGRLQLPTGMRDALVVPAAAIERIGQIERVRLVRDGAHAPVVIRTGKVHGDEVEVLSGLAEGEEVLLR